MRGTIFLPGDKSIAHRAIILSALAGSKTVLKNIPFNEDSLATINAIRKLGIKIKLNKASCQAVVFGKKLFGLIKPGNPVFYIKESGTTFRLLLGILAGQDFKTKLHAGPILSRRPMLRVIKPLRLMGARISARRGRAQGAKREEYPPIIVEGGNLKGITYKIPVASAQVKGALLLAGLFARGQTKIIEPVKTRDHTERMLKLFKAKIKTKGNAITIAGGKCLVSPCRLYIPSDISSAAFFMVAASIVPDSEILIKNVSLNPGRLGLIKALKRMGGALKIEKSKLSSRNNEPMGDILVFSRRLRGIRIRKSDTPSLIDELPILMVAASLAKGVSVFENVGELRVKETDRVKSMLVNLTKMSANIKVVKSGAQENIIIKGVRELCGSRLSSFGDHRTAMSMTIAGLASRGKTSIDDLSCINKSFPNFLEVLNSLT
ncbi:MAG: 3-phosphoshikimate 1-carboxyvinyltransferase [Candidatus Omnitrophota bacterium]|nr:3-phosphoshikimate 1-carboxyvinyltransferase [Candidatus Omnitrophota bacterium]